MRNKSKARFYSQFHEVGLLLYELCYLNYALFAELIVLD